MVDRIKKLMEYEEMTSAHFADYLDIGRAVMSHILNGRNKPSLEVVTKILSKIDYIDSNWLLTGQGTMLKENNTVHLPTPVKQEPVSIQRDLFGDTKASENEILQPIPQERTQYRQENEIKQPQIEDKIPMNKEIKYTENIDKRITKIIIYYSDNTFETFNPEITDLKK